MKHAAGDERQRRVAPALLGGLLAGLALAALGCRAGPEARAEGPGGSPRVELVRTPDGGIQPQAVVDSHGTTHLVYLKGDPRACDIFYTRRGTAGWSSPVRVNSEPGSAVAMGTIRGAQVTVGKSGRVHVLWFGSSQASQKGPSNSAPVLYSRLNDARTAFEPQRNLMQFTSALDGGGSVAADGAGNVYAVWHGSDGTGNGEESRQVFIARSRDEGKTFTREAPAYAQRGVCPCCSNKAFADSKGVLYVLYRAAIGGADRDMYLLTSRDRGQSFQGINIHRWKINT